MPYADAAVQREYMNRYQRDRKLSTAAYRENPERRRRQRDADLQRQYGISIDDYEAMVERQGGRCAICGNIETEMALSLAGVPRGLAVDHDHITGVVRGLLCRNCNTGLGHFADTPALLEIAAVYLGEGVMPHGA